MEKTEFFDQQGRQMYIGDIIQYRLSLNSKHGGPTLYRVDKTKRHVTLCDPRYESNVGIKMQKQLEPYISIIDTSGRVQG